MQVAELRERLAAAPIDAMMLALADATDGKITPAEASILSLLLTQDVCSKSALYHCYAHRKEDVVNSDMPDLKVIDVYICRLRKKLAPLGLTIETIWGQGYRIPRENAAEFMAALEGAA